MLVAPGLSNGPCRSDPTLSFRRSPSFSKISKSRACQACIVIDLLVRDLNPLHFIVAVSLAVPRSLASSLTCDNLLALLYHLKLSSASNSKLWPSGLALGLDDGLCAAPKLLIE